MAKTLNQRLKEGQKTARAVENTIKSEWRRNSRIKKRIEFILEQPFSYFITFTITDDYLKLKDQTLIRQLKKALQPAKLYIANSDYGSKNGRLHFHAVVSYTDQLDYTTILDVWQYGSIDFKPIIRKDSKSIKEYILKTTNHTIKTTVGKIIYGRLNNNT